MSALRPDADFGDLLDLLAAEETFGDRDRIRAAILTDGRTHAGAIDSNRVREALTNPSGELDVWHKRIGPQYHALKAAGLIVEGTPIRSTDRRGRNAHRWIATYRLTEDGWSA